MKKLILLIFIILISFFEKGYCGLNVQNTGGTTIAANYVYTPIRVDISTLISLTLNMKVKCLDQYITNITDSTYKIPISQLYLNDGISEFQMIYNTDVQVISGILIDILGLTKNYNCYIRNIGVLPPGTYTTRLQFNTYNLLSPMDTATFTLTFTIPLAQNVSTITNPVNITLTPDNVFDGNAVIDNTTSPQVVVQSNGEWKLVLDTSNLGTLQGKYYFLITGVSSNVTNYINSQTQIQPNQQYVLASGNPTVTTPITGNYVTDYINIKYTLKNTSGTYIPEGVYNNYANYIIKRKED